MSIGINVSGAERASLEVIIKTIRDVLDADVESAVMVKALEVLGQVASRVAPTHVSLNNNYVSLNDQRVEADDNGKD